MQEVIANNNESAGRNHVITSLRAGLLSATAGSGRVHRSRGQAVLPQLVLTKLVHSYYIISVGVRLRCHIRVHCGVMRTLLMLLQLTVVPPLHPVQRAGLSPADSVHLRARADSAIRAFQQEWSDAWSATQASRPFLSSHAYVRDSAERAMAVHCHWDVPRMWLRQRIIQGSRTAQATCPRFLPPDVTNVADERRSIDNGLDGRYRLGISAKRHRLRALLDSAAQQLPGDIHLVSQRVRFALDADDLEGAVSAALSCGYEPVQCGLLQGLILYRVGDVARADSAFTAAANFMNPEQRCAWNDVRMLLDSQTRTRYERISCAARAEFEARLWWLADPLWLEAGNERRVEHFARKVMIELLVPFGYDGRQHFAPRQGGESVIESLVRYGWPSQMFWGGIATDAEHDQYLESLGASTARPYIVREYSRAGRLHTLPLPRTLDEPFAATREGWQLTEPNDDDNWWPQEHYARDLSAIVALPVGQMVMLRRRDATRLVWAGELDSAARGRTIDPNRQVAVFDSRSVGDVKRIESFPVRRGTRVVVDAPLAPGRTLLGIEVSGDSSHAAARTRYSADVDAPLSALNGARAISQALLFEPPTNATQSVPTQQAIDRMYSNTTLHNADRIGVYWESYGFRPADTLDLSVRITRDVKSNVLARTIRVFGIGESAGNDVAIRWRELPANSRAIHQLEGAVPVQLRSIVVEVSRLPRGSYVLQLTLNRPGEPAVTSERRFDLR